MSKQSNKQRATERAAKRGAAAVQIGETAAALNQALGGEAAATAGAAAGDLTSESVAGAREEIAALEDDAESFPPEDLVGREVAGKASTLELEEALAAYKLEPEHVLGWHAKESRVPGVVLETVIVTQGGRKLRHPGDVVPLTPSEKDGIPRAENHKGRPEGFLQGKGK